MNYLNNNNKYKLIFHKLYKKLFKLQWFTKLNYTTMIYIQLS